MNNYGNNNKNSTYTKINNHYNKNNLKEEDSSLSFHLDKSKEDVDSLCSIITEEDNRLGTQTDNNRYIKKDVVIIDC